jgi:pyruvyl transferase EpsO
LLRTDKEALPWSGIGSRANIEITDWIDEAQSLSKTSASLAASAARALPRCEVLSRLKVSAFHRLADHRLNRGCRMLSRGRVVVTDRLHGHILCTLMNLPHVVLDNTYGKIGGFRSVWETGKDLCESAATLDDAIRKAEKMLAHA